MKSGNNPRLGRVSAAFLILSSFACALPLRAQDVVTSEDFTGGSSAFVFRTSRRPAPKKTAFNSVSNVKRSATAKLETLKRVARQTVAVAKTNPKRQVSKEVDPSTVKLGSAELKRKTPQETSVVFAGVGEYWLRLDNLEESINWFRESSQLDPKNVRAKSGLSDALTRKGEKLLTQENYDIAKLIFNEALSNNPSNAGALAGLAEIASAKNDQNDAIANYEKAVKLDADLTELNAPLGVLYFQKGEIAKAEIYLQKAVAADPENAETQLFLGLLRYKQTRFAEAETALRKSISIDPNNADAHYYLGDVLSQQKKDDAAITSYEKAVAVNPKLSDAWFDLGAAYFEAGRGADAIKAYKTVVKLDPRNGDAYVNLADVFRHEGDWDGAIGNYRMAMNFVKPDSELLSNYGYVSIRRAVTPGYSAFWKTATDSFEKAVAIKADYIDYTNLGWSYYNFAQVKRAEEVVYKENLTKARDAFIKANTMNPVPKVGAAINLNLGMTLNELNQSKDAVPVLKTANEQRKDWVPALNELGIAYRKTNDFDNAIKSFKRTLELDGKYAAARYNLAESLYRNGKKDDAKKEFEKLKTLDRPDLVSLMISVTNGGILR